MSALRNKHETPQEINQVYWSLPECYQDALNLAIFWGHSKTAAECISNMAMDYGLGFVSLAAAQDWVKWRKALRRKPE